VGGLKGRRGVEQREEEKRSEGEGSRGRERTREQEGEKKRKEGKSPERRTWMRASIDNEGEVSGKERGEARLLAY